MRQNGPLVVVLAFLATLIGIRTFTPESPSSAQGEPPGHSKRASGQEKSEGGKREVPRPGKKANLGQPLLDFLGIDRKTTTSDSNERDQEEVIGSRALDIQHLIVCVPDPVDSVSGYRFDALVDAVQRAIETQEYVLDRFSYPWPDGKRQDSSTPSGSREAATPDSVDKEKGDKKQDHATKPLRTPQRPQGFQPGELLFRAAPNFDVQYPLKVIRARDLLIGVGAPQAVPWAFLATTKVLLDHSRLPRLLRVFLVGETATAGIHKAAFAASVRLIKKSRDYQFNKVIRVLGPYFSGSQVSLEYGIRNAWAESDEQEFPLRFQLISGSATNIARARLVAMGPVTFQATVAPDPEVIRALLEYLGLCHNDPPDEPIRYKDNFAFLYETNTAFGQHTSLSLKEPQKANDKEGPMPQQQPRKANDKQEPTPQKDGDKRGPTWFPFPLHVSEVRAAYTITESTRDNTLRLPSFGSKLRLPLGKIDESHETEPSLDSTMTAVTTERMLGTILTTLSHQRFRYVFILASDVKDILFLASLIRRECPECRLVLLTNDLLLTHPDFSSDLRGSLVGSSYPLYSKNQCWSLPFQGKGQRFVFPGQAEQGYYNATIALLNPTNRNALLEYGPPFPELEDEDRSVKKKAAIDRFLPPIWISMIGAGGVYPVKVFPHTEKNEDHTEKNEDRGYVFRAPSNVENETLLPAVFVPASQALWIVPVLAIFLLLVYIGLAYGAVVFQHQERTKVPGKGTPVLEALLCPREDRLRRRQRFYTFVTLTSVLVVYCYLSRIWLIPAYQKLWQSKISPAQISPQALIVPVVLVVALLAFLFLLAFRAYVGAQALFSGWKKGPLAMPGGADPDDEDEDEDADEVAENVTAPVTTPPATKPAAPPKGWYPLLLRFCIRQRLLLLGVFLLVIMATYLVRNGRLWTSSSAVDRLLFFERATNLASGLSPVVPVFLLGMAFFCWGYVQLKRLYLLQHAATPNPFPGTGPLYESIVKWHKRANSDLRSPGRALAGRAAFLSLIALFFAFCRLSSHFVPSVEGVFTESLLLMALAVLAVLIVYGLLHLRRVWKDIRKLLQAISLLPLGDGFQRIPQTITNLFGLYLSSRQRGGAQGSLYQQEQYRLLAEGYSRVKDQLLQVVPLTCTDTGNTKLDEALLEPSGHPGPLKHEDYLRAVKACLSVLQHVRSDPCLLKSPEGGKPKESEDIKVPVRQWLAQAENFVCLEVTRYISQFFVQLRNLALFLTVAPLLMLVAVTSYPFQPQRLWLMLAVVLIAVVTLSILGMIIRVERDELMSRIMKTTPNQLNLHWPLISHLGLYAVPLLGILIAMSSDVSDLVHSWVDPLLQLMK